MWSHGRFEWQSKPREKRRGFNRAFNKELMLPIYNIPGINAGAF